MIILKNNTFSEYKLVREQTNETKTTNSNYVGLILNETLAKYNFPPSKAHVQKVKLRKRYPPPYSLQRSLNSMAVVWQAFLVTAVYGSHQNTTITGVSI